MEQGLITKGMFRFIILSLTFPFLFACNNQQQVKEAARLAPQYYYYPRANVYFDSANKEYLFLASDGQAWQTAKQIPAVVQGLMDKTILIQSPADPVWKDNEKHRLVYSAVLYATPNDTVAKKEVPRTAKKPSGQSAGSSDEVKKERKGVRKFIDKIFGGLKKERKKEPVE